MEPPGCLTHDISVILQAFWLRSMLNEKETELLELRDQHAKLLVRVPFIQFPGVPTYLHTTRSWFCTPSCKLISRQMHVIQWYKTKLSHVMCTAPCKVGSLTAPICL